MTCKSRWNLGFIHKSPQMPGECCKSAVQLKKIVWYFFLYTNPDRINTYGHMACDETGAFREVVQGDVPSRHFTKKKAPGHLPIKFYFRRKPGESVVQDGVPPGPPPVPIHFERCDSWKTFKSQNRFFFFTHPSLEYESVLGAYISPVKCAAWLQQTLTGIPMCPTCLCIVKQSLGPTGSSWGGGKKERKKTPHFILSLQDEVLYSSYSHLTMTLCTVTEEYSRSRRWGNRHNYQLDWSFFFRLGGWLPTLYAQ